MLKHFCQKVIKKKTKFFFNIFLFIYIRVFLSYFLITLYHNTFKQFDFIFFPILRYEKQAEILQVVEKKFVNKHLLIF